MIWKIIRASLTRNKVVSTLMSGFLVLSAALLGCAVYLLLGVFGTVDSFMEEAQTPHFMQMHTGPIDLDRVQAYVDGRDDVVAWEAIELLNVENSALTFNGKVLETEIQQNGFVTQPARMDFLLSLNGDVIQPRPGEIWVPLFYEGKYHLENGQHVTVNTPGGEMTFTIAGVFRDSKMNSTLASSKRLLISDVDYADLQQRLGTEPEYLISFRLTSPSAAGSFEAAYANAGLESNGPSLTWSLFRLINSINDVLTVALFTLMSLIILLISLLCIRYTLLTTLEEDLREIGVMKALGISNADIRSIYQGKYRLLLGGGAIAGFLLSLVFREAVLAGVRRQMGTVNHELLGVLTAIVAVAVLYLVSIGFVRRVLQRLHKIAPLQALHGTSGLAHSGHRPRPILKKTVGQAVNLKIAWANVRRSRSQHITVLLMAMLITLVLLIPFRFGATFRSPDFTTYLGMSQYDLRVDLLNRPDALEVADRIVATLGDDQRISKLEVYTQEVETVIDANGERTPLRIEYGNHDAFPVRYSNGRAPQAQNELGLSEINAERLGVKEGDSLQVINGAEQVTFVVTGTYQDITNGGKTAKALPGPTMNSPEPSVMIAVNLSDKADADAVITGIRGVADVQVIDTHTFVSQMMGDMIGVLNTMSWVFAAVAGTIAALIAGLSIRLMQVQERKSNAVQIALGFTSRSLRSQYIFRIIGMMLVGALFGVVLASPVGALLGNALFSVVGVSGANLVFSPITTVMGVGIVILSALVVILLNTSQSLNHRLVDRLRG